jgi:hypothetical protein
MNIGIINATVLGAKETQIALNFGAISVLSPSPIGYAILRADGTIWNFSAAKWDTLPSSGLVDGNHYQRLSSFATRGPLLQQQYAAIPAAVFTANGVWFATFALNSDGSIASQVDDYPMIPGISQGL